MEISSATFVMGVPSPDQLPPASRPEVAFVGRSNVGKSSLINALLRRRNLARTSATPGKTREFNLYLVNEGFHLVDLPGLGYARVSKAERSRWSRHLERYLTSRESLRLLFHLIDSRHRLMQADRDLVDLYRRVDVPVVAVLTKADKLSGNRRAGALRGAREDLARLNLELPVVLSSATTGAGRREILDWIDLVVSGSL